MLLRQSAKKVSANLQTASKHRPGPTQRQHGNVDSTQQAMWPFGDGLTSLLDTGI